MTVVLGSVHCARSTDFVFKLPEEVPQKAAGSGPGTIEGQVTNTTGEPLAGIDISVKASPTAPAKIARTDANGMYKVEDLAGAQYIVDYNSSTYHSLQNVRILVVNERSTVFNAVMTMRPGSLAGKVVDAQSSQGIEGVLVEVRPNVMSPVILASTLTNAAGRYQIAGLTAGEYAVNYSKVDYIPVNGVPATIRGGRETTMPDLSMQSVFGNLRGRITRVSDGQPIPNVLIEVRGGTDPAFRAQARTGANGEYLITRLREGSYTVDFTADGYFPILDAGANISAGQTTVLNQVMGGTSSGLRGKVTNATNGAPVFGVTVTARSANPNAPSSASTRTDMSGEYMFPGLPPGPYVVDFVKSGYFPIMNSPVTLPPGGFAILNQSMSQVLLDGDYRIVVTWTGIRIGAVADVDSYLTIPGSSVPAIYYGQQSADGADLDRDDTDWEGPETTTIRELRMGTYTFYVNNYNVRCQNRALGLSEVKINVYNRSGLIKTYTVPPGVGINYEAFHIVDGRLVDIERYNDSLWISGSRCLESDNGSFTPINSSKVKPVQLK